jgi:hypothetical protein
MTLTQCSPLDYHMSSRCGKLSGKLVSAFQARGPWLFEQLCQLNTRKNGAKSGDRLSNLSALFSGYGGVDGTRTRCTSRSDLRAPESGDPDKNRVQRGNSGLSGTIRLVTSTSACDDVSSLACHPKLAHDRGERRVAGSTGLEPAASGVTGRRSNQLNYNP